jgi:anaerobic ribonucleoside-triphosphate reductase
MVERQWKNFTQQDENAIVIEEAEKQCIRENIMQCIYQTSNNQIMKQFVRSLKTIAKYDYPARWP